MIYFSLWVAFLLAVLLAVPTAVFLEKRKYRAEHPAEFVEEEPAVEEGGDEIDDMPVEDEPEFAEVEGGDDFSAFDEI